MPFLIFDIESVIDRERVLRTERSERQTKMVDGRAVVETWDEVFAREHDRICKLDAAVAAGTKECFFPARYQAPATVCMLLVNDDLSYIGHTCLDHHRSVEGTGLTVPDTVKNTVEFWNHFHMLVGRFSPLVLVSFGGTSFDMPVLEASAMDYGASLKDWMVFGVPAFKNPRHQSAGTDFHIDLMVFLGQGRGGTLNYWSRLVGMPGKIDTSGGMVSEMLKQANGREHVRTYCWLDVLNLYGLFWATRHTAGYQPTEFRDNPIFEATIDKVLAGQGLEAQKFISVLHSDSKVPF